MTIQQVEPKEETQYTVKLHSVTQKYSQKKKPDKIVFNDINLHVKKGEFVTVVGPSGCGKSTLLRLMLGQEVPVLGNVEIMGKQKRRPDVDVGIVYQRFAVFPHLTALENIAFGPLMHQTSALGRVFGKLNSTHRRKVHEIQEKAEEMLGMVNLDDAAHLYPRELSGGMQQRIAIAQALIMNPPVLLMDEPFSALDEFTREKLQIDLVKAWQELGMTIVFVTHQLEEAVFLGTRVIVLSQHYHGGPDGFDVGAKIVMDLPITAPHPRAPEIKDTQEMGDLLGRIRHNKAFTQNEEGESLHIGEFSLEHPDSIHM